MLSAALIASACQIPLFSDACGPEFRETSARGVLVGPAGAPFGSAELRLLEFRDQPPPLRVQPVVMGPGYGSGGAPLKGHVTAAEVVDSAGRVLLALPALPGPGDQILDATQMPVADGAVFAALRELFLRGGAVFRVTSDLPDVGEIRAPLVPLRAGRWGRTSCA